MSGVLSNVGGQARLVTSLTMRQFVLVGKALGEREVLEFAEGSTRR